MQNLPRDLKNELLKYFKIITCSRCKKFYFDNNNRMFCETCSFREYCICSSCRQDWVVLKYEMGYLDYDTSSLIDEMSSLFHVFHQ